MGTDPATTDSHRPWPRPASPPLGHMTWSHLLFAHWPVDADGLRAMLPPGLELDLFEGRAWLSIVPFVMEGTRPRGLPAVPWVSDFPELNVRTYVKTPGDTVEQSKPGVWFFSLDAASRLAVRVARRVFKLPYFDARMGCEPDPDSKGEGDGEGLVYQSLRTHRDAPPGVFRARYRPTGPVFRAEPGTLDHWLTERYSLYAASPLAFGEDVAQTGAPLRSLIRGEVHHEPWPLQPAEAEIEEDSLTDWLGLERTGPPRLHFARRLEVLAWRPERLPVVEGNGA